MAGLGDLFGANAAIEQLFLWNVAGQVITALASPAFIALTQDMQARNPELALNPELIATAVAHHLVSDAFGRTEAAKTGINPTRFEILRELATVRLSPAELAEAVLRSYMTAGDAQAQATPQGIDAGQLRVLTDLAGDAPGAQQLAEALRRGIIARHGRGPDSTSYDQGIAETRLHNKWGDMLAALSAVLLSPADSAEAVIRNFMSHAEALAIAEKQGVSPADFATMIHLAGDAPGPQQLAEALRRGAIPEHGTGANSTSFDQGIAEGRLADKWADVIKVLAQIWPTPVNALEALLKGQVTHAEGLALYEKLGGAPEFFEILFNTQGSAPTPLELIEMANRGYIPWTGTGPAVVSYEQGFKEGPWRDKWAPVYRRFAEYLPPESTVVTLLSHGAIGQREAAELLARQGMSQSLITAYLDEAHTEALSDYRGLSVNAAITAYEAHIVSAADTKIILESLHVSPSAADLMLAYADIHRAFTAVGNAIARVRTLFAARKITDATARESLIRLNVPSASIDGIMQAWELENSISVKVLTEAQIAEAFAADLMTQAEATTELENIGYTPFDAWVLLSVKHKAPLPGRPSQGPAGPQGIVKPGTT
jgi:hypothetical protein